MLDPTDPVLLVLAGLLLWWHGAAVVAVVRSRRAARAKLLWILGIVGLPPFGVAAYFFAGRGPRRPPGLGVTGYLTLAAIGAGVLLLIERRLWPGHEHLAWIVAWSVVTFVAYAVDKSAAKRGKDERGSSRAARVDELALHLLAVLGGFVGGWLGRHGLRHKTNKPVFAVVLVLATALHVSRLLGAW